MLLIRNEFNLETIKDEVNSNKSSWFNEIYNVDILNHNQITSFLKKASLVEKHHFLNDMVRWIKKISSTAKLKMCSFEISFIEEISDENILHILNKDLNIKGLKFLILKYVFINNEYYVYVGNVEDTTFIKI